MRTHGLTRDLTRPTHDATLRNLLRLDTKGDVSLYDPLTSYSLILPEMVPVRNKAQTVEEPPTQTLPRPRGSTTLRSR